MRTPRLPLLPLLLAACAAPPRAWSPPAPHQPPALEDVTWIADQRAGRDLSLDALLDALSKEEVVFLGETHLDENTHRLELAIYEGLVARRPGKVVLAMEMFERDVQAALDDYLAGRIPETEFLMRARPWQNYRSGYRPLIEAAKRHGLPVIASNAPAALRMKVAMGGKKAFDELPAEERALLPRTLHDNTPEYWERVARTVRGHMGMAAQETPEQRLYSSQNLWDNAMGESCVLALERHPGSLVLHVNGGFHSQHRGGAVHQLLARRPATRLAVVEAVPVEDLYAFDPFGAAERAEYLAFVLARARGPSEGFLAVTSFPEMRFRLHLPPGLAEGKRPPLVIWLGDDGLRAADLLAPLAHAFGGEAAIAVLEPPYPMVGDDLALGGRWYWPETFSEDLGTLGSALPRIVGFLLRTYPLDEKRVVLAGEGTGGTVVAATSLYVGSLDLPAIASAPRRYGKLRTLSLPGPGEAPEGAARRLLVLAPEADEAWWKEEAEAWRGTGLPVAVERGEAIARVREALAIAEPRKEGAPLLLLLLGETPRARVWAETYAQRLPQPAQVVTGTEAVQEGTEVQPLAYEGEPVPDGMTPFRIESLMDGLGLPLAPGPFGGTTMLVVPKGATEEQRALWKKLEETDAIKKRSRFARLVVLFENEEGAGIAAALEAVRQAKRSSVLLVPAVFCAGADQMARLRAEARPYEEVLDLAYLPGLGGSLPVPAAPKE